MSFLHTILRRRSNYCAAFESVPGQQALADLKRFCRYGESPIVTSMVRQEVDPIATAVRIGRQEVFQRIVGYLNVDDALLLKLKEDIQDD